MPLLKYTNYHSFNALIDRIYTMIDKCLYRKPDVIRSGRSRRDVKKNYTFHEDIGHNTERCIALKDEIKRLIRARYFKEFLAEDGDQEHNT